MKLLATASNRPDAPIKGLKTYGKTVSYDQEAKRWTSEAWGVKGDNLRWHPVWLGQGVA